ncbi:MAG: cytochrome C [Planctomycetota bacterium]|nr:MAG: cytochrome C [Planctomycetota bacterium]
MLDEDFFKIIKKPDNVPITMMIYFTGFCTWLGFRQAAVNDDRMKRGEPLIESGADDKVLVWPDLVYTELIALVLCTAFLVVWAILLKAPLEPPANPTNIPNPSKAPWYFLGLQELLVYFDPWIAGVLLPGLIIVGLIALPYIDKNPRGNGYYTLKERPLVISVFMFGFVIMWCVLIVLGTFLRGPNWNLFGPYETWDPHRPAALLNINVSDVFWVVLPEKLNVAWWKPGLPSEASFGIPAFLVREAPGIVLLGGYFFALPVFLAKTVFRKIYTQIGLIRYAVFWLLLSWMFIVPIKMVLRWLFNMKYFVAITEWFLNV